MEPNGIVRSRLAYYGAILPFEQPPIIRNNRTLVPLRAILEALGAEVGWDSAASRITATKGGIIIALTIGDSMASINGDDLKLDTPPIIVHDYTFVPARFVSEALGANVTWDEANKTVVMKSA